MSRAALTLHSHDDETLRNLERTAEALGISIDEFAVAGTEPELASVGAGIEGRLVSTLESLKSYPPENLERDIRDFARREVDLEDPLRARRVERQDVHGI